MARLLGSREYNSIPRRDLQAAPAPRRYRNSSCNTTCVSVAARPCHQGPGGRRRLASLFREESAMSICSRWIATVYVSEAYQGATTRWGYNTMTKDRSSNSLGGSRSRRLRGRATVRKTGERHVPEAPHLDIERAGRRAGRHLRRGSSCDLPELPPRTDAMRSSRKSPKMRASSASRSRLARCLCRLAPSASRRWVPRSRSNHYRRRNIGQPHGLGPPQDALCFRCPGEAEAVCPLRSLPCALPLKFPIGAPTHW